jgi:hypothetical protein
LVKLLDVAAPQRNSLFQEIIGIVLFLSWYRLDEDWYDTCGEGL